MSLIEDHFHLHRPPFPQNATDSAILQHNGFRAALERLRFGLGRQSISVLTAVSGAGKSTVIGTLKRELDPSSYQFVYSSLSTLSPFSLLSSLSSKLGLRSRRFKGETAQELIGHFRGLAKRTLLVLDEAHAMPDPSMEDLRLLTADSLDDESPFALILAGLPTLRERLAEPQHLSLAQRIAVRARLSPLTEPDIALFLDKHLRAAGASRNLFEPEAVAIIFQHSRGIPRQVQNIAIAALFAAAEDNKKVVDADAAQRALLEVEAP